MIIMIIIVVVIVLILLIHDSLRLTRRGSCASRGGDRTVSRRLLLLQGSKPWLRSNLGTKRVPLLVERVLQRGPKSKEMEYKGPLRVPRNRDHGVHALWDRKRTWRHHRETGLVKNRCCFGHSGLHSCPGPAGVLVTIDEDLAAHLKSPTEPAERNVPDFHRAILLGQTLNPKP